MLRVRLFLDLIYFILKKFTQGILMKLNPFYPFCIVGVVGLLNACSSGGTSVSTTTTTTTPISTPTTTTNTNTNTIQGTRLIAGRTTAISATVSTSDRNKVVVNGTTLDFIPAGFSVGTIDLRASNMTRIGSGNSLAYTRFGLISDSQAGNVSQLFAQGQATTNMPKSGSARYTGKAVHVINGSPQDTDGYATFNVNYGDKTITGIVTAASYNTHLAGTINGNGFAGTKSQGNGMDVTMSGHFYGSDAKELGGVYHNGDHSIQGAFGASK